MVKAEIKKYIGSVKWQFAKTMPEIPHEYTVADWNPDKTESFYDFVKYIREYGKDEMFYDKKFRCLEVDNYKYWTMGAPVEETTVINRKKIIEESGQAVRKSSVRKNVEKIPNF